MLAALWLSSRKFAKQSCWPQEKSIQDFSSNSENGLRYRDHHLGLQKGCRGLERWLSGQVHMLLLQRTFLGLALQSQGIWHPRRYVVTIYTYSQNTNRHKIKVILKKAIHESLRAPISQGREKGAQKGRKCHGQANRTQRRGMADAFQAWIWGLWNETSPWEKLPTASTPVLRRNSRVFANNLHLCAVNHLHHSW